MIISSIQILNKKKGKFQFMTIKHTSLKLKSKYSTIYIYDMST